MKQSNFFNTLSKKTVECGKWEKWLVENNPGNVDGDIDADRNRNIAEMCGHYVFNDPEIIDERNILFNNIIQIGMDPERYTVYKIKESINRYINAFNN